MPPWMPAAKKAWKETDETDEGMATCPWCGYVHVDSWEFSDNQDADCHSCEKPIRIVRHVVVTYVTKKGE